MIMAKIILSFNGNVVKEYELDRGSLSIGRDEKNDIHIDNPAVSSRHAKILTILNESFIEDLDSTNGTYFYGKKITGHAFKNGESIFIGEHELNYINTEAKISKGKTVKSQDNKPEHSTVSQNETDHSSTDDKASNEPGAAKLQILSESNSGKELLLTKIINTLGKADEQVAAVLRRPDGYYLIVVDAGEGNKKPLVNGATIDKQEFLIDGDIIEVAGVQMRFQLI